MNKILPGVVLFGLTTITLIPYWTGVETERQFEQINQTVYSTMNLNSLQDTFQRGWFHSYAQSLVEIQATAHLAFPNCRFKFVHEIDHGLLPIQATSIHTTVHVIPEHCVEWSQISETVNGLEIHTTVPSPTESQTTLTIPPLRFHHEGIHLQWQGLQSHVLVKQSIVEVKIHLPKIQFDLEPNQVIIHNVTLNVMVQLNQANAIQSVSRVNISDIQLTLPSFLHPIGFQGIQWVGKGNIINEYLMLRGNTRIQQIRAGVDHYGPSICHLEFHRWHIPTLIHLTNALLEMKHQDFSSQPVTLPWLKLIRPGLTFFKHLPEFTVTQLKLNTPVGKLWGTLQIKVAPFKFNVLALLNPVTLLNALTAQLEIRLPNALLYHFTEKIWLRETASVNQSLKTWLTQDIWIPVSNTPNQFYTQMRLAEGTLHINGESLTIKDLSPVNKIR